MNPLVSAMIGSIIEGILQPAPQVLPETLSPPGLVRPALQDGPLAVMDPPDNGYARIGGKTLHLAANLQIRDVHNRIILPFSLQNPVPVLYKLDAGGSVQRVWVLSPEEAQVAERLIVEKRPRPFQSSPAN